MALDKQNVVLKVRRAWVVSVLPRSGPLSKHQMKRDLLRTHLRYGIKEAGVREDDSIVLETIPGNLPTLIQNLKSWLESQGAFEVTVETEE